MIEKLLESVKEFKAQKKYEGVDWESVKDKYENIRSLFIKKRRDENDNETFTRDKISSKIKAMRGNYRKAVNTGRQSGGGRAVATFYELCQEIWAGSPATESIASGVESSCYTNNDDYNEPIDFNPGNDYGTRVMRGTEFSKTQTQEEGTVLLECLCPDEGIQLLENHPIRRRKHPLGPRATKRCRYF